MGAPYYELRPPLEMLKEAARRWQMETALWTWSGIYFGYRDSDNLWTHDGRHVGRFHGDEVYGPDGRYLGEIQNDNRLITRLAKKAWRRDGFVPYATGSFQAFPVRGFTASKERKSAAGASCTCKSMAIRVPTASRLAVT
jgi:hypothetical protein